MFFGLCLTATVLVLLAAVMFWRKGSPTAAVLMLLFYNLNLFHSTFTFPSVYYIKWGLFVGLAPVWALATTLVEGPPRDLRNKKPLIFASCFIISAWVSAVMAPNPGESILRAGSFLLLLAITWTTMISGRESRQAVMVLLAIYGYDIIVVICSFIGVFSPSMWNKGRFVGLFYPHASVMVVYAYSALIVSFALVLSYRKYKLLNGFIFLTSLIALILTKGRAGYVAAICGTVAILFVFFSKKVLPVLAYILLLGVLLFALLSPLSVNQIGSKVLRGSSVEEIGGPRLYYMRRAIQYFWKNPVFGIGMGTIPKGVKGEQDPGQPLASATGRVANQAGYHLLLVETGAFGFLFYLGWLLTSLLAGWSITQELKAAGDQETLSGYAAFLGLLAAYAANGIFEGYPSGAGNILVVRMWALAGIFMAFQPLPQESREGLAAPGETELLWEKA